MFVKEPIMRVFVVRREAGGGDIDEIMGVFRREEDALACIQTCDVKLADWDDITGEFHEMEHVGMNDDSERVWFEIHELADR